MSLQVEPASKALYKLLLGFRVLLRSALCILHAAGTAQYTEHMKSRKEPRMYPKGPST